MGQRMRHKFSFVACVMKLREHFIAMALNTKNEVLAVIPISVGSLSASVVHPREVFRELLKYPLDSFIVCHNH